MIQNPRLEDLTMLGRKHPSLFLSPRRLWRFNLDGFGASFLDASASQSLCLLRLALHLIWTPSFCKVLDLPSCHILLLAVYSNCNSK